jgi:ribosomal protein L30E
MKVLRSALLEPNWNVPFSSILRAEKFQDGVPAGSIKIGQSRALKPANRNRFPIKAKILIAASSLPTRARAPIPHTTRVSLAVYGMALTPKS